MANDLSVVIPVYNTEKYLRRCLDSIVNQEGRELCDLRVLCINDGSTDSSEQIIREYMERYPFIELFTKENGGLADVRNYALDLIRGSEYTISLDSDDYWEPTLIREFMAVKDRGYDLIFFDINMVDYRGNIVRKLRVNPDPERFHRREDYMVVKHAAWSKICKTELYEGLSFPVGKLYEDLAVMPVLSLRAKNIGYIRETLIDYVVNTPGSIMNSSKSNIFDIYDALNHLFALFGDEWEKYREELQYICIEHLCVGHTYRLLKYPEVQRQDFDDVVDFMEKYFGKKWTQNKYVRRGMQKVNLNSSLALVVPQFLFVLKNRWFSLLQLAGRFI